MCCDGCDECPKDSAKPKQFYGVYHHGKMQSWLLCQDCKDQAVQANHLKGGSVVRVSGVRNQYDLEDKCKLQFNSGKALDITPGLALEV